MAPLVPLLALLALATSLLASPHVPRNVHSHAHRAPALPAVHLDVRVPLPLPRRKRSLNKRCIPRPTNSTSAVSFSTTSSTAPSSTAPINVAPLPSSFSSPAPAPAPSPSSSSSIAADTAPVYAPPSTPTTTSTHAPPPPTTTTSSSPPAQTSSGGSSSQSYSGQATYYDVGLGACGDTNVATDFIVAVSEGLFDNYVGYNGVNPNTNAVCNKKIEISYPGVAPITVVVKDRCTGCQYNDLDLSRSAFQSLADLSIGRIDITWKWSS